MALADFFSRTSIAAATVLDGFEDAAFRKRVSRLSAIIAFDANAASTSEGQVALNLAVDLLSRFYPTLSLMDLDNAPVTAATSKRLKSAAKKINPAICVQAPSRKASFCLVIGESRPDLDLPLLFLGSEGWTAKFSRNAPVGSTDSANPFGASVAACLGVANAFRIVFADQLPNGPPDANIDIDVLNLRRGVACTPKQLPTSIELGDLHLVGLGAIGRATVFVLAGVTGLSGTLHLVDHESIELSNLQRYVGVRRREVGDVKVASAAAMLSEHKHLTVIPHALSWGNYLFQRKSCSLDLVAVALDTAHDRMTVQAALPRRIVNAWTQPGDLGVSRHDFTEGPCLMCLYLPTSPVPSQSELVADAVGLPEIEVRQLLYQHATVDGSLASRIAAARDIPIGDLVRYVGLPLSAFYAKAVCGTTLFGTPRVGERGAMAVPMAFQSALAGILLAVEIIASTTSLRSESIRPLSKINLLRPLGAAFNEPAAKHVSSRCICQDSHYIAAYREKYS